jgi:hypothetical protein
MTAFRASDVNLGHLGADSILGCKKAFLGSFIYWVLLLGLCGASGNRCYWVLLLVYVGPRATHFTGYCCWFTWGLGQHILLGLMWAFSNGL